MVTLRYTGSVGSTPFPLFLSNTVHISFFTDMFANMSHIIVYRYFFYDLCNLQGLFKDLLVT